MQDELIANLLNVITASLQNGALELDPAADLEPAFAQAKAYLKQRGWTVNPVSKQWVPVWTLRGD